MAGSVLVGYATQYGSTREVADAVAEALRARGFDVDVQPAGNVRSLDGYRAVVLGAPLYIGRWHKDAVRFVARHGQALAQRPLAIFALGPLAVDERQATQEQLDQELAKLQGLDPVDVRLFGGKYDPNRLSLAHKLLAALPASPLHGVPARDARDWEAIEEWARGIARKLEPNLG